MMNKLDSIISEWINYQPVLSVDYAEITDIQAKQLVGFGIENNEPTLFKFLVKVISGIKEFNIIIQHDSWSNKLNMPAIEQWNLVKTVSNRKHNSTTFFNPYIRAPILMHDSLILPIPFGKIDKLDLLLTNIYELSDDIAKVFAHDLVSNSHTDLVAIRIELTKTINTYSSIYMSVNASYYLNDHTSVILKIKNMLGIK